MNYQELYTRADNLMKKYNPCDIIDGTCTATRLTTKKKICSACTTICNHFNNGCQIKNIMCRAWTCPELNSLGLLPPEFIKEQENIIKEVIKLKYDKYCLTKEEQDNGVEPPMIYTSNHRINKLTHPDRYKKKNKISINMIKSQTPRSYDPEIHQVISFSRKNHLGVYKLQDDDLYHYNGDDIEITGPSINFDELSLLGMSDCRVEEFKLKT